MEEDSYSFIVIELSSPQSVTGIQRIMEALRMFRGFKRVSTIDNGWSDDIDKLEAVVRSTQELK